MKMLRNRKNMMLATICVGVAGAMISGEVMAAFRIMPKSWSKKLTKMFNSKPKTATTSPLPQQFHHSTEVFHAHNALQAHNEEHKSAPTGQNSHLSQLTQAAVQHSEQHAPNDAHHSEQTNRLKILRATKNQDQAHKIASEFVAAHAAQHHGTLIPEAKRGMHNQLMDLHAAHHGITTVDHAVAEQYHPGNHDSSKPLWEQSYFGGNQATTYHHPGTEPKSAPAPTHVEATHQADRDPVAAKIAADTATDTASTPAGQAPKAVTAWPSHGTNDTKVEAAAAQVTAKTTTGHESATPQNQSVPAATSMPKPMPTKIRLTKAQQAEHDAMVEAERQEMARKGNASNFDSNPNKGPESTGGIHFPERTGNAVPPQTTSWESYTKTQSDRVGRWSNIKPIDMTNP